MCPFLRPHASLNTCSIGRSGNASFHHSLCTTRGSFYISRQDAHARKLKTPTLKVPM